MFYKKDAGGVSWLLVCLGNPGDKYEGTRHNVGFMVADEVAERRNAPIQRLRFKALTNILTIAGEKVLVMEPITYMNLSGEAVRQAAEAVQGGSGPLSPLTFSIIRREEIYEPENQKLLFPIMSSSGR